MNWATWNVQGLSKKMNEVISELKMYKIDIAILTETKKKGQGSENLGYYDHFYSGVPKDTRAARGVSIIINKKLRRFITTWEAVNERIIKMNIQIRNHKVTIIGVYAPNNDALIKEKEEFFEKLHYEISIIGNSREIMLLGDLNSRIGKKQKNQVVGEYGEEVVNENGNRLISVCEQNELKIMNGFYQHRRIHKYTRIEETRNFKSIIDYLIMRQKTSIRTEDVRVYRGASCGSDHYLLKAKIMFPVRKDKTLVYEEERTTKINEQRFNLRSLEQESVKLLYKNRLDSKLQNKQFEKIGEHYDYIKNCIHEAAAEALGFQQIQKRRQPYWWDEEIEKAIEEKKKKYEKFMSTKTNSDKIAYKQMQAQVRRKIVQKKNETWEKSCNRINTYLGGSRNTESWKIIKSLRKETRKDIVSSIKIQKWDEYFKALLTENRKEFQEENETQHVNVTATPIRITVTEVEDVCRSLKNGKAPGLGNIPAELIKNGTKKLYMQLTKLFQECISKTEIPDEWRVSIISTIHKKGCRTDCNNYRGIAVTSSLSRVYGKILKNRIEKEYSDMEAEEQAGFRAGRSTVDHLFSLTQIIEKRTAYDQEVHLLFVDLKKAYDNVPLSRLWETLERTNINSNLIKAVKSVYKNNTAKVKVGQQISEGFYVNKGLKQGCCLSPTLFKIYVEQALKYWKRKCGNMGIPLDNNTLYTLCFADDQVILAQQYDDIEYMTRKLIEEYRRWGLEVNIEKTEYMCIGGIQQDLILNDEQLIKGCQKYKYLGVKITKDGMMDEAIKDRNNQGRRATALMNGILWDSHISKKNKHRIYNTIIKSIVTYGSEVWQLKVRTEKTLEATEMDYWRRAAGKSKLERITNERIREMMEVTHTIVDDIKTKQLKWYGHVQRMPEERIPKQILKWKPIGRRKRGRPRRSWREGIDREIRERGIEEELWENREEWRLGIGRRRRTL